MAAGATYEPIATQTLGTSAAIITFNSIPSVYTDLRLVLVTTPASNYASLRVNFNSDTNGNYSRKTLYGDQTDVNTISNTGLSMWIATTAMRNTAPSFISLDIFSYSGSTDKVAMSFSANDTIGAGFVNNNVGLWRSASSITRIDLELGGINFNAGTIATLYGIKAA